ncbi:hypothetical protein MSG28_013761 [Choristoneura fumiferana]|uniref:Uncharacterized protein n=1 Tax=Choristoneura fumiferana TaxID=7141 RepID=A0ACC0K9Z8_CHOFU|nr:hypothetical protein MSG28_013761 [Choristoneura fumiferana]
MDTVVKNDPASCSEPINSASPSALHAAPSILTIPVLNFGMLMGWQSPMTPLLKTPNGPAPGHEPTSDETISWMASVTFFPPIFCGCLIASDNVRGALGSLFILSQNLGYLVVYVAGDVLSFPAVMWLCTAVPVLHLVAFLAMPETPVFLIKQGKIQETCGYLVVLMYAGSIFERAAETISLKLSPNKQTIVVGVIQLLGSIVASCIVEKTGRKWLLASTSFATGLSMLALGAWFYVTSSGFWLPGWLPVLAMCLCIFADAAGYQPVPYVITSELFSFQHRGMVTSFVSSVDALSDFLQTKAYDPLLKILGIHWVFIMFSGVCFLGTLYTVLWVPETKDRTVEEIYALLEDSRKKEKRKDVESGKEVCRL